MRSTGILAISAFVALAGVSSAATTVESSCRGLSMGPLRDARLVTLPKGTLLRSGSYTITSQQVAADIARAGAAVKAQYRKNPFHVLEQRATSALLAAEARAWARANDPAAAKGAEDALIRAYLTNRGKGVTVSDMEARAFYSENKAMVGGASYDAVAKQIKTHLLGQKRQEAADAHVQSLSRRHVIDVDAAWFKRQAPAALDNIVDRARRSGKPAMIDFGAAGCIPCDKMAPILTDLKARFAGRCTVDFVPVREEQVLAARYGVSGIPVQIFFDRSGKEVYRHVGFLAEEQILARIAAMGVK